MSWKPSRSSGVMYDKYYKKSEQNRNEINSLLMDNSYLKFENINKLSKHIYLYWLNDNKTYCALSSKAFTLEKPHRHIEQYIPYKVIKDMLLRNKELVYKPMLKYLN